MKERDYSEGTKAFIYFFVKTLVMILSLIPRSMGAWMARIIGRIWWSVDARHRSIATDNIAQAYGDELTPLQVRAVARATFIHLAGIVFELPKLFLLDKDNLHEFVNISGIEHARKALGMGTGVVFLTAHYGNWELLALAVNIVLGVPIHVMVRPLDLEPADRVLTELRGSTGNVVLDKDKSAGAVAGLMRDGKALGILLDQNSSWYEGVYVPFFNRVCCTNKGLALFALRHGAVVVPAFSRKRKDGKYDVEFDAPVDLIRTGKISRDIEANTALFNDIMEAHIRKDPTQWLWVHRRWRIKPIPDRARRKMGGLEGL